MGALTGLKVIEMSAIGPVPFAGMLLADMGADVVVIDKPDDLWKLPGDVLRRGKHSVELNLKSCDNINELKTLIKHADVLIEGSRPGVMERLGLGPDVCAQFNERLIYARMTGWGQTGPLSQAAGHDINYIALTGALHAIGRASEPPVPPLNLVGDFGGGSMFVIMGILAALYERHSSGKGQVVDAAITEGTANLMSLFYSLDAVGAWRPDRGANMLDSAAHFYDTYQTSDDKFISLGAIEPKFYQLMIGELGLDEEDFDTQQDPAKWPELKAKIATVVKTKSRQQWCDLLEGSDVCFAPVLDYHEAAEHVHMKERNAYININGRVQPSPSPRFNRTPSLASEEYETSDIEQCLTRWL